MHSPYGEGSSINWNKTKYSSYIDNDSVTWRSRPLRLAHQHLRMRISVLDYPCVGGAADGELIASINGNENKITERFRLGTRHSIAPCWCRALHLRVGTRRVASTECRHTSSAVKYHMKRWISLAKVGGSLRYLAEHEACPKVHITSRAHSSHSLMDHRLIWCLKTETKRPSHKRFVVHIHSFIMYAREACN